MEFFFYKTNSYLLEEKTIDGKSSSKLNVLTNFLTRNYRYKLIVKKTTQLLWMKM